MLSRPAVEPLGVFLLIFGFAAVTARAEPRQSTPASAQTTAGVPSPQATPPNGSELPAVDDPMLMSIPPPSNILRSWQEGVALVRSRSTNLKTVLARVSQAEAQAEQALSGALPTLTANANLQHHLLRNYGTFLIGAERLDVTLPYPPTIISPSLSLRVPLLASRAWFDRGTAERAVEVARWTAQDAERLAIAGAANAIASEVTSERLAEVSRVALRSALSTLDLHRRRAALGAASMVDVLRAEQDVAQARLQVIAANESLFKAREALGTALGFSEAWGVTSNISLDALIQSAAQNCQSQPVINQRADLRAASANVNVAERRVKSTDYALIPKIDGVSTLTYFPVERISPNRKEFTWTIGGLLTWELYDGGVRYAQKHANQAEKQVTEQQLTELQRKATLEVTQSRRAVQVAEANLAVSRKSREVAGESSRLARVAFLNGSGTSFDLVDTGRQLRAAELDLAVKEFDVLRAKITAMLALANCHV